MCCRTDSSGSRLCHPGDVSDHPRWVCVLVRGGDGAGGCGSPGAFAGLKPSGCGEGRLLRTRRVCRHLLRSLGSRRSRGEPQSRRLCQKSADWTARLCSHPSPGAGPPPPFRATPTPAPGSTHSAGAEGPRLRDPCTSRGRSPRRGSVVLVRQDLSAEELARGAGCRRTAEESL